MKKTNDSEGQNKFVMMKPELGNPIDEACREEGRSEQIFYHRNSKDSGILPGNAERLGKSEKIIVSYLSGISTKVRNPTNS